MSQRPTRKRPFGVIAIIILKIVTALSLIVNVIVLTFNDTVGQFLNRWANDEVANILNSGDLAIMITLAFILAVLVWHLALIIGLWLLKRWV